MTRASIQSGKKEHDDPHEKTYANSKKMKRLQLISALKTRHQRNANLFK